MNLSYIDVQHIDKQLHCWTRNMDGELEYFVEDESEYSYLFIPDNTGNATFIDMYKRPMKQVYFDSRWEMSEYAKKSSITHESDVGLIYKYILDNFIDAPTDAPYNVGYYDIEVDFDLSEGTGYPSIHNPFGAINSISLMDKTKKRYVMFMLHSKFIELKDELFDVDCRVFLSERELLRDFAEYIDHIDILLGWNTKEFDLNYIMARLIKLFGESKAITMLCRNGHKAEYREYTNDFGEEVWEWKLVGRLHLDMMAIYKKFKPKGMESYSLDSVCMKELGISKVDFDGDLGDLYREDPERFFEYSLHDSRLLYLLDKKLNLTNIAMLFSRDNCVLATDITGTVRAIEQGFMKFCRKKGNIVLPDKKSHNKEDFKGAVVYDTITGLIKKLFSIDLTGLYPSVMIMLGLSAENLLMQLQNEDVDYYKVIQRSDEVIKVWLEREQEYIDIVAYELDDIIRESGYTISASGTVYDGTMGLLAEFVKSGFDMRNQYKGLMKKYEKEGDTAMATRYDLLQSSKKLGNNSLYGAIANNYFRMFDIRMARSITYTGALISKHMTYKTNETLRMLEREYATV